MLYRTWPRMLSVASHSRLPPYLAVTIGPVSHSPPPIAAPPISRPGPRKCHQLRHSNRGASGSSPTFHRGIRGEPGCGATTVVSPAKVWVLAMTASGGHKFVLARPDGQDGAGGRP